MKEGVYEFGDARAVVKQKVGRDQYGLWLIYKDCVVTMDDGALLLEKMDEGVELSYDDAFMVWEGVQEVTTSIFEIFNVLSIASGGQRDADDAYERGRLEGENKVLRDWNEQVTGKGTTPSTSPYSSRPFSGTPWGGGGINVDRYTATSGSSYHNSQAYPYSSSSMQAEIDGDTDGVEEVNPYKELHEYTTRAKDNERALINAMSIGEYKATLREQLTP